MGCSSKCTSTWIARELPYSQAATECNGYSCSYCCLPQVSPLSVKSHASIAIADYNTIARVVLGISVIALSLYRYSSLFLPVSIWGLVIYFWPPIYLVVMFLAALTAIYSYCSYHIWKGERILPTYVYGCTAIKLSTIVNQGWRKENKRAAL